MLFAILKTKKLQANCNLRNIHKQFGQHNTGEQHKGRQRSDSADPFAIDFPRSSVSCETSLLEKTIFRIRQKGVPPLLLPASVLQLPRCLVRICNLFLTNHKIANLTVSKNAIAAGKTDCKIEFASQMWATRPHLGSIFEKLLHRKTFLVACGSYAIIHFKSFYLTQKTKGEFL